MQNFKNMPFFLIFPFLLYFHSCNLIGPDNNDPTFEIAWATSFGGEGIVGSDQQQYYDGSFICFGDLDDPATIFGYDVETGEKSWEYIHDGTDKSNISLNYRIDEILLCVTANRVFGFSLITKELIWEIEFGSQMLTHSTGSVNDELFFLNLYYQFDPLGGFEQWLYEIDPLTGGYKKIYVTKPNSQGTVTFSPPIVYNNFATGHSLLLFNERPNGEQPPEKVRQYLKAIDYETKEVLWESLVVDSFASNGLHPPVIYKDIVITGGYSNMYGFDVKTGDKLWEYSFDYPWAIWNKTNHLIQGEKLYVNNGQYDVTCLAPETGDLIWNNPEGGPNCTDNMLYYEKEDYLVFTSWGYGSVMVLDAYTGEIVHQEKQFEGVNYNNDIVYSEVHDMFFTSTYNHAIAFKLHGKE